MSLNLRPLSVGNVVSAGLRLYRDHFKQYFSLSLTANLWLFAAIFGLLPIVLLVIIIGLITGGGQNLNIGVTVLLSIIGLIAWVTLAVYSTAKLLNNSAAISRLAFGELVNKPETVSEVRRTLKPKLWKFWVTQFLANLILGAISFGISILQLIFFNIPAAIINNEAIGSFLLILGNLVYLVIYIWFYARFWMPEVPLAVEQGLTSSDAIARSWKLTQGFAWRIALIVSVAVLMTIPVYLLSSLPLIAGVIYLSSIGGESPSTPQVVLFIVSLVVSIILFIVLNIVALPFWQALKSVIYYDLRSRREGLGLSLRDFDR